MPLFAPLNNVPKVIGKRYPIALIALQASHHNLASGIVIAQHAGPMICDGTCRFDDSILVSVVSVVAIPTQVDFRTHRWELGLESLWGRRTGDQSSRSTVKEGGIQTQSQARNAIEKSSAIRFHSKLIFQKCLTGDNRVWDTNGCSL